jgi:hypothetical protein
MKGAPTIWPTATEGGADKRGGRQSRARAYRHNIVERGLNAERDVLVVILVIPGGTASRGCLLTGLLPQPHPILILHERDLTT